MNVKTHDAGDGAHQPGLFCDHLQQGHNNSLSPLRRLRLTLNLNHHFSRHPCRIQLPRHLQHLPQLGRATPRNKWGLDNLRERPGGYGPGLGLAVLALQQLQAGGIIIVVQHQVPVQRDGNVAFAVGNSGCPGLFEGGQGVFDRAVGVVPGGMESTVGYQPSAVGLRNTIFQLAQQLHLPRQPSAGILPLHHRGALPLLPLGAGLGGIDVVVSLRQGLQQVGEDAPRQGGRVEAWQQRPSHRLGGVDCTVVPLCQYLEVLPVRRRKSLQLHEILIPQCSALLKMSRHQVLDSLPVEPLHLLQLRLPRRGKRILRLTSRHQGPQRRLIDVILLPFRHTN
mmetsp:Transcript_105988/g.242677  ORF Transcript_105988/g.242677 Transcript_105988/m.242677 type:complete len:338 (-) Transcript_105988:46-1059(-)